MMSLMGLYVATYLTYQDINKPTKPLTTVIEGKEIHRSDIKVDKYIQNTVEEEKWIDVICTGYTASVKECGKSDGITSSGVKVSMNRGTSAMPKSIPYGTKVYIPELKSYNSKLQEVLVKEDIGGAIKFVNGKMKIDVYFDNKQEALDFGIKHLKAKIIK